MKLYFLINNLEQENNVDDNGNLPIIQAEEEYIMNHYWIKHFAFYDRTKFINETLERLSEKEKEQYKDIIEKNIYIKEVDMSKGVIVNE